MLNINKGTKTKLKPKPAHIFTNCSYVCIHVTVYNCRTQHSTEQLW